MYSEGEHDGGESADAAKRQSTNNAPVSIALVLLKLYCCAQIFVDCSYFLVGVTSCIWQVSVPYLCCILHTFAAFCNQLRPCMTDF